jgi:hypothetical protein
MHLLVSCLPLTVEILPPITSGDRLIGLICLLMFLAGIGLAYPQVVRRWKARMESFFAPLLRSLSRPHPSVKEDRPTDVSPGKDRAA